MPESLDYGLAENHSETDKFDEKERTDRKRERERERGSWAVDATEKEGWGNLENERTSDRGGREDANTSLFSVPRSFANYLPLFHYESYLLIARFSALLHDCCAWFFHSTEHCAVGAPCEILSEILRCDRVG